jgi:hypothetical protein
MLRPIQQHVGYRADALKIPEFDIEMEHNADTTIGDSKSSPENMMNNGQAKSHPFLDKINQIRSWSVEQLPADGFFYIASKEAVTAYIKGQQIKGSLPLNGDLIETPSEAANVTYVRSRTSDGFCDVRLKRGIAETEHYHILTNDLWEELLKFFTNRNAIEIKRAWLPTPEGSWRVEVHLLSVRTCPHRL